MVTYYLILLVLGFSNCQQVEQDAEVLNQTQPVQPLRRGKCRGMGGRPPVMDPNNQNGSDYPMPYPMPPQQNGNYGRGGRYQSRMGMFPNQQQNQQYGGQPYNPNYQYGPPQPYGQMPPPPPQYNPYQYQYPQQQQYPPMRNPNMNMTRYYPQMPPQMPPMPYDYQGYQQNNGNAQRFNNPNGQNQGNYNMTTGQMYPQQFSPPPPPPVYGNYYPGYPPYNPQTNQQNNPRPSYQGPVRDNYPYLPSNVSRPNYQVTTRPISVAEVTMIPQVIIQEATPKNST